MRTYTVTYLNAGRLLTVDVSAYGWHEALVNATNGTITGCYEAQVLKVELKAEPAS